MGYTALAYHMKGLAWYCWGQGMWNLTSDSPAVAYPIVSRVNTDARAWWPLLRTGEHRGLLHTRTPAPDEWTVVDAGRAGAVA